MLRKHPLNTSMLELGYTILEEGQTFHILALCIIIKINFLKLLTFRGRIFFLILAHPVFKM
jgi:hypothetical protein